MAEIKEKTTTDAIRMTGNSLPDVNAVPATEIQELIKDVQKLADAAKDTLLNNSLDQLDDPKSVYSIAVATNIWLLRAKAKQVENAYVAYNADPKTSLSEHYIRLGLTRKKWQNYKKLSVSVIAELEFAALASYNTGECDLDLIPTLYKAIKLYDQQMAEAAKDAEEPDVLNDAPDPKLVLPADLKFQLIYADLADGVDINIVKEYAADDATMFVWVDGDKLPEAINFIQQVDMTYQTSVVWDMGNSRFGGQYSNRQHSMLLVAQKGKVDKPQQCFRFKSIAYFVAEKGSTRKPHYYDDVIYNMFPDKPCLELHHGKKYNPKWFGLEDIKNKDE